MSQPTLKQLTDDLGKQPALLQALRENPQAAINEYLTNNIDKNPKEWDNWIYRLIVIALGLTMISIVIGVVIAINRSIKVESETLVTIVASIGSGAVGALAGLLAPSPTQAASAGTPPPAANPNPAPNN